MVHLKIEMEIERMRFFLKNVELFITGCVDAKAIKPERGNEIIKRAKADSRDGKWELEERHLKILFDDAKLRDKFVEELKYNQGHIKTMRENNLPLNRM
jgi:hypothetical protein